jgi:hypothetical protein
VLCATTPVNGLGSAWLQKDIPRTESTQAMLAGVTTFLKRVRFLGASPADWATSLYG